MHGRWPRPGAGGTRQHRVPADLADVRRDAVDALQAGTANNGGSAAG
ncbi:hypothetical protein [uncultured Aquincola sp.]